MRREVHHAQRKSSVAAECSGALGDLGTLLAHGIGAMIVAGLAPVGVLFGFGAFLIASGLFYGLPMAVQPMKAVSAVMLTGDLRPEEVAASGLLLGATFLVLGATGAIRHLTRLVPQTVTTGLQLGLGLSMAMIGFRLMAETPCFSAFAVGLLLILIRLPRVPAVPIMLGMVILLGWLTGTTTPSPVASGASSWPIIAVPSWDEVWRAIQLAVVPQLPLTLTNAVIVTAAVSRDLFPAAGGRASERNLALSTGMGNLLLAPLGAMPMCHGAGGVQAQYRFGARTGLAPVMLGTVLIVLALIFSEGALVLLTAIPMGAVGALLMLAGVDLALSKRLFDARPSCWPVIGITTVLTLGINPAVGLAGGWIAELAWRPASRIIRKLFRRA